MKDIFGFEGLYAITEDGKVWSYPNPTRKTFKSGHWMKEQISRTGYKRVFLYKNKKSYVSYIHRLLAIAYIPNPENKPTVDHINRNPGDNRLDNLRWATLIEQVENRDKQSFASYGMLGKKMSDKSKKILSQKLKGRVFSEETKKKMSNTAKNKTDDQKKKCASYGFLGKKHSEETKKKISEKAHQRYLTECILEG